MACGVLIKEPIVYTGKYWENPIYGDDELKVLEFRYKFSKDNKECHQRPETSK